MTFHSQVYLCSYKSSSAPAAFHIASSPTIPHCSLYIVSMDGSKSNDNTSALVIYDGNQELGVYLLGKMCTVYDLKCMHTASSKCPETISFRGSEFSRTVRSAVQAISKFPILLQTGLRRHGIK
jgi:hypothetical protein